MQFTANKIFTLAGVTLLVMYVANQAVARNATLRRYVRGGPISVATNGGVAV